MIFASLNAVYSNFNLIFSLVATLAAIVLGFLSAKNKVTISALEESNRAYAGLIETNKLKLAADAEQMKLLQQKADVLENHITQAPDINNLAVQLGTQHKEMMKAFSQMTKELGNVAKAVMKDAS